MDFKKFSFIIKEESSDFWLEDSSIVSFKIANLRIRILNYYAYINGKYHYKISISIFPKSIEEKFKFVTFRSQMQEVDFRDLDSKMMAEIFIKAIKNIKHEQEDILKILKKHILKRDEEWIVKHGI